MKFNTTKVKSTQRLRALSKKLGTMVEDGSFFQLCQEKQLELRKRLLSLCRETSSIFSRRRIRRILASSAMLIGLAVAGQAQSFKAPVVLTNGLVSANTPIYHFADIDGDGDQDAFMSVYGADDRVYMYQENTGTAEVAAFADPVQNGLGVTVSFTPTTIDFSDVDNDGDLDLFMGSYGAMSNPIYGWENTGTGTSPSFNLTPATNPFNFQPSTDLAEVAFVDLDGDGDQDVLMNDYQDTLDFEQFRYQENLGIMGTFPAYEEPLINPFGLMNMEVPTYVMSFEDLDKDGDQDLMISGNNYVDYTTSDFHYYENTGTATAPAYAASVPNPFNLDVPENSSVLVSDFVDLDNDGDADIVATIYSEDTEESILYYYENLGEPSSAEDITVVQKLKVFPTVADDLIQWEVKMLETINSSSLHIMDVNGRIMHTESMNLPTGFNRGNVAIDHLTSGMYILHLADAQGNTLANRRFFVR